MAVGIWVGVIQVGEFRNNAGLLQGKQVQNGWSQFAKTNDNLGQVDGNLNIVSSAVNIVNNLSFIDMFFPNPGVLSPVMGNNIEAF